MGRGGEKAGAFKAKMEISVKRSDSFFERNEHKALEDLSSEKTG